MRGEWIEIILNYLFAKYIWSLPMRGEWIEIEPPAAKGGEKSVSPHAGRVD